MKLNTLDDLRHAVVSLAGMIRNHRKTAVIGLVCCAGFTFHAYSTTNDKVRNREERSPSSTASVIERGPDVDTKSLVWADRLNTNATSDATLVRTSPKSSPGRAPRTSGDERLEVENIILTRFGFEPNSITRSSTKFLLSVENRSPADDIELHLDSIAGIRLHQQQVASERPDWRDFFTLEPGDYVLSEANHPDWVCKIKITAR